MIVYVLKVDMADDSEFNYRIEGVYSTRELAEAAAPGPRWVPGADVWVSGEYDVTPYELDKTPTKTRGA